jgi:predicted rRNA methylase YqxC with S4 and FtsJ domains
MTNNKKNTQINKTVDLDALFLEIGSLKIQLEKLNKTAFVDRSVNKKWTTIFIDPSFVHLKKLVSILLSIFFLMHIVSPSFQW